MSTPESNVLPLPPARRASKPRMTAKRMRQQLDDAEQSGYVRGFNAGRRANKRPFVEFGAGVFMGIAAAGITWLLK